MSNDNGELTQELKELNKHLKELRNSGKHMLYSANPFKFGVYNFIAGIFHALATLFGYVVIFGIIAYLVSQANLNSMVSKWVENTLQQVNWNKVVPMPENSLDSLEELQRQTLQGLDPETIEQLQRQMGQ